ncbi:MAG: non-canonical purine NTP pyrophosphatase [Nisaea sp.]|nr:non-canonical purine NTP pyrophosphatase [Nisaea sp.]OUX97441.1 MAG: non-canonical purine NTP pyrophosphatase [Candidatus Endolissoclinum sp. TMED26]
MAVERRPFSGDKLVIASHNAGKVREIAELVLPLGVAVLAAADLSLPEPEETGDSFIANAALKALAAATATGLPALADDSGFALRGLDGVPGIYSARWAGPDRDFDIAMAAVWQALMQREAETGVTDRQATFICALSLAWPDGHSETFEGRVDGTAVWPPQGTHGFGYDAMFLPTGGTQTYGQCDPAVKHADSHRARAFRDLLASCFPRHG